jgi:hypothetical protein
MGRGAGEGGKIQLLAEIDLTFGSRSNTIDWYKLWLSLTLWRRSVSVLFKDSVRTAL